MGYLERIRAIKTQMNRSVIGQERVVDRLIIGLLANGNLLLEGLPGLAKTRAVKAMADAIDADFSRIQFTPDLLPSDVTGSENMYEEASAYQFRFEKGPIFGNIILADEINRAPAKVQSAMLEAMQERQITVSGTTHPLPELFMVLATQNPIEQEGTYPLPEAQMDRFLMHVQIEYPDEASEMQMLQLLRQESSDSVTHTNFEPIAQETIFAIRKEIASIKVAEQVDRYIIDLVFATRYAERYSEELASLIDVGASPRASIALDQCARVHAWMQGRDYVVAEDVRSVLHDVLRHRITLSYAALAKAQSVDDVITMLEGLVAISV